MNSQAIGIFDSGVGGLTVLRAVRQRLPHEHLVYLGDTARVPYGNKSPATIERYACEDTQFLLGKDVKMIIIACNTASALAAPRLRAEFPHLPIMGMIGPGARAAISATRTGRIGIIATAATVASGAYAARLAECHAQSGRGSDLFTIQQACPLFVPLIEEGETHSPIARMVAEKYLAPLRESAVDTLVLGCTHYPLLKDTIGHVMGEHVTLVDSAEAAATEAAQLLADHAMLNPSPTPGEEYFYVTDAERSFFKSAQTFLGYPPAHLSLAESLTAS
jgi:glutamate racemase